MKPEEWGPPGDRPCYPLGVQTAGLGSYVAIPGEVAHSWHVPADFHFVDCETG